MDLTVNQSSLHKALRLIGRIAPARTTLPILQAVLMETTPAGLSLTATDGDLGVQMTLPAEVAVAGRTAIPARLLSEYIAQLPPNPVRLNLDTVHRRVQVACGRIRANLAAMTPEEFPALPALGDQWVFDLEARRLQTALDHVAFAASHDTSRPILTGVLFDFRPDGLMLAAADGFRLARTWLSEASGTTKQLLVPSRAVAEFSRLLDVAEAARLALTPDVCGLYLSVGTTTLFTRLIDGRFPDIARLIPQTWQTSVTLETSGFRQSVRVASLFGAGRDASPVVLDASPGLLQLRARGDETGDAQSEIVATVDGEAQSVVLNTRLLTDLLDVITGSQIQITWVSPQTPVVVREIGGTADEQWVIMPLHNPALMQREVQAT